MDLAGLKEGVRHPGTNPLDLAAAFLAKVEGSIPADRGAAIMESLAEAARNYSIVALEKTRRGDDG